MYLFITIWYYLLLVFWEWETPVLLKESNKIFKEKKKSFIWKAEWDSGVDWVKENSSVWKWGKTFQSKMPVKLTPNLFLSLFFLHFCIPIIIFIQSYVIFKGRVPMIIGSHSTMLVLLFILLRQDSFRGK